MQHGPIQEAEDGRRQCGGEGNHGVPGLAMVFLMDEVMKWWWQKLSGDEVLFCPGLIFCYVENGMFFCVECCNTTVCSMVDTILQLNSYVRIVP
jgi:hypothetical protein